MLKSLITSILLLAFIAGYTQIQPIPKVEPTQEINKNLKGNGNSDMFNNVKHPLSITGGILTLGGAALYVVGSEMNGNNSQAEIHSNNYQPQNTTQYVGIGLFAVGAALFTIFSTERDQNVPKRKKEKQKYNASDWEATE